MARYLGPKNRLARREGIDLGLKTIGSHAHASLLRRLNIPPGMHGPKRRTKLSGFGEQLREKQKVKRMYGVLERQFRRYFEHARKWRGNTGEKLFEFLECRLDNVLYRLGFCPTRAAARQLTNHGHVRVNGKKVNIPSYHVKPGEVITISAKGLEVPAVKKMIAETTFTPPLWLARQAAAGRVVRLPERSDVKEDINESLIVEFYSR